MFNPGSQKNQYVTFYTDFVVALDAAPNYRIKCMSSHSTVAYCLAVDFRNC
jgi:hypothetical protein